MSNFLWSQTVSQMPYPAIPAATALIVSPLLIQQSSHWLGERGELKVRLTVEQSVIQWWRVGAYRDPTVAHPLVVHRSPDGGPTRWSGLPLETCWTIGATVPMVEPGSFKRSCDPTVKPLLRWWGGGVWNTPNGGPTHPDQGKWPGSVRMETSIMTDWKKTYLLYI
jgi:hypothetical protein